MADAAQLNDMIKMMTDQQAAFTTAINDMKEAVKEGLTSTTQVHTTQQKFEVQKIQQKLFQGIGDFRGEDFLNWKFRTESAARMFDKSLTDLLNSAEISDGQIEFADLNPQQQEVAVNFYNVFAQKLHGEASHIVQNVLHQNGAELWRKLCNRFHGKSFGKKLHMLRKVVSPEKVKKLPEVIPAVETWEG